MLQEKYCDSVKILSVNYDLLIAALKKAARKIKKEHAYVGSVRLFGSFLKGNYTPESDIDIIITVTRSDTPFLQRREVFLKYFKDIPFDINILVYTRDEIGKMLNSGNMFIETAINEALDL